MQNGYQKDKGGSQHSQQREQQEQSWKNENIDYFERQLIIQ